MFKHITFCENSKIYLPGLPSYRMKKPAKSYTYCADNIFNEGLVEKINVKRLIIGHFSSKYDEPDEFEKEVKDFFENCELAIEGLTYLL